MYLRDRLNALMKEQGLTRRQLADGLDTPIDTLKGWLDGKTPPAVLGTVLDLIEKKPKVSRWLRLGTKRIKLRPRGKLLPPGHQFRFGDPRRPAALAEACAKRKAKAKPTDGQM